MATLLEKYQVASNIDFQGRVRAAATKVALDVAGEAPGTMTEVQTIKRQNTATAVLQNAVNWSNWALALIATNATIASAGLAATDGDIEFVIPSIWDDMAGVTSQDL